MDARASCAGRGGSLARIYTFEENQMVGNLGPVSQKLSCGTVQQKSFEAADPQGSIPSVFFHSDYQVHRVSYKLKIYF